ncbi:MAG TPA: hypothetical protein VI522_00600, partial [Gammaproteobacteria bacterium]|nr:hypothetical protein [Gammaproteobacteria bacterium]
MGKIILGGLLAVCTVTVLFLLGADEDDQTLVEATPYTGEIPNHYVYIIDQGEIFKCLVNNKTGNLADCPVTGVGQSIGKDPTDIAFIPGKYAYISHSGVAGITQCQMDSEGDLQACQFTTLDIPKKNSSIALHKNHLWHAYLTPDPSETGAPSTVHKCDLTEDTGQINTCTDLAIEADTVTFQTFDETTYAYLGNLNSVEFIKCTVNAIGDFFNCKNPSEFYTFKLPAGVSFARLGAKIYAYIAEFGYYPHRTVVNYGQISRCEVDPLGDFVQGSCVIADPAGLKGGFVAPLYIDGIEINGISYVYLLDRGTDTLPSAIWNCSLNAKGELTHCQDSG